MMPRPTLATQDLRGPVSVRDRLSDTGSEGLRRYGELGFIIDDERAIALQRGIKLEIVERLLGAKLAGRRRDVDVHEVLGTKHPKSQRSDPASSDGRRKASRLRSEARR
jgi:hypothetical protein